MKAAEFIDLLTEFEAGVSNEAKFAKSKDRLEPLLQNISNDGGTLEEFSVNYQSVYEKKKWIKNGWAEL